MYKLFTDKTEIFECDISISGASLQNSEARLIIESNDINLLFKGKLNSSGKCQIPVKKLKGLIGENTKGSIKLEVIADDTYFVPWKSDFVVEASKKVMVEVKSQSNNLITDNKPKIKVSGIKEQISSSEKNHVINIMRLLIKENINISNLHIKRNKLNNIIATYTRKNPLMESKKKRVIQGITQVLIKKK
jgi:hypothetical protein